MIYFVVSGQYSYTIWLILPWLHLCADWETCNLFNNRPWPLYWWWVNYAILILRRQTRHVNQMERVHTMIISLAHSQVVYYNCVKFHPYWFVLSYHDYLPSCTFSARLLQLCIVSSVLVCLFIPWLSPFLYSLSSFSTTV